MTPEYQKGYIAGFKAAMSIVPHRWCSGEKIREYMHEALDALDCSDNAQTVRSLKKG